MALARVQATPKAVSAGSTLSLALTFAGTPVVGNGVIVLVTHGITAADTACVDNHGNTYVLATTQATVPSGGYAIDIWYCAKITATGAPFTLTVGAASRARMGIALEVSGVGGGLAIDKLATATAAANNITVGPLAALTVADAFLVGGFVLAGASIAAITVTATTPVWTQEAEHLSGSQGQVGELNSSLHPAALGTTPQIKWTWATAPYSAGAMVAFKASTTTAVESVQPYVWMPV